MAWLPVHSQGNIHKVHPALINNEKCGTCNFLSENVDVRKRVQAFMAAEWNVHSDSRDPGWSPMTRQHSSKVYDCCRQAYLQTTEREAGGVNTLGCLLEQGCRSNVLGLGQARGVRDISLVQSPIARWRWGCDWLLNVCNGLTLLRDVNFLPVSMVSGDIGHHS